MHMKRNLFVEYLAPPSVPMRGGMADADAPGQWETRS